MKLTPQQRAVIGYVALNGTAGVPEIARGLRMHEPSVRYTLSSLLERRIIRPRLHLNTHALGYTEYQIFFSLLAAPEKARSRFATVLKQLEQVTWLCPVGGAFEYDVMIAVRDIHEVTAFFDTLSRKLREIEMEKVTAAHLSMYHFAPKYIGLERDKISVEQIFCGPAASCNADEFDLRILASLRDDPLLGPTGVARKLKASVTTVQYRLQCLRSKGIITAQGYYVDPFSIGALLYVFLIDLKRSSPDLRERLIKYCREHKNIIYLVENLGAWDFQAGVAVADSRNIPLIIESIEEEFASEIRKITPLSVYEPLKLNAFPFSMGSRT